MKSKHTRGSMVGASALVLGLIWMFGAIGCTDDSVTPTPPPPPLPPELLNQCANFGTCMIQGPTSDDNFCTIDECDACGLTVHRPGMTGTWCAPNKGCMTDGVCMGGMCVGNPWPDGTTCFSDDLCAPPGTCLAGTCITEPSVVCEPSDQCWRGQCVKECFESSLEIPFPSFSISSEIETGDVNNDGVADLFLAAAVDQGYVSVLRNGGDGSFFVDAFTMKTKPHLLTAVDLNGDGFTDLAIGSIEGNSLDITLNDGFGIYSIQATYPLDLQPRYIAAGDLNADGRIDLAVGGQNDITHVFLNEGSGSFAPKVSYEGGQAIAMADFNGDTFVDLAVTCATTDSIRTLFNKGDGTFEPGEQYGIGSFSLSIAAADIDGNGLMDLVVAKKNANALGVFLNKGDGSFDTAADIPAMSPSLVLATDMNADGLVDLIVSSEVVEAGSLLFNKGAGSFADARSFGSLNHVKDIVVADLNGDGKPDVALPVGAVGKVFILLNECLIQP